MITPLRWMLQISSVLIIATTTFLVIGCSSDRPEHQADGPKHHHVPPLAGQDTFFNGQITAELTVGHGPGFDPKPAKEGDEPEHKRHGDGGGGFHMGGGAGSHGGGRHHQDSDAAGAEDGMPDQIERQRLATMRHAANPNPPVMIHLRFTNNGTTQAELLVADFLSPLGNFVVEPEKLTLAPGQTLEVEPMTSRLVGDISGATVTLALRLAGRGEKKDITLSIAPETSSDVAPKDISPEKK